MNVGIDSLSFYSSHYYLPLEALAAARGVAPERYTIKLGQREMAVSPPAEDVVTMAANAALQAVDQSDRADISWLIFATESAVDQSKAAGTYVHKLLNLPSRCRVFEIKQACYGATAALAMACHVARQNPSRKVLIVASDIARYGLGSAGEPTHGAGAAAMLISASPRLLAIEPYSGYHTEDTMDFWRPNYRDEAIVDGAASVRLYLQVLLDAWRHYREEGGPPLREFSRFCYHLPFTRMAEMAHRHLLRANALHLSHDELDRQLEASLHYNRRLGNTYAASLYIALASLLDNEEDDLDNARVGLFSYGSGCMGEFFSGIVQPGYRRHLHTQEHRRLLDSRKRLTVEDYEELYRFTLPVDGSTIGLPADPTGSFRLSGMRDHQRLYEAVMPL